ncbi:MAG: deoxynucleoside kinase [Alloprevotella sp.]|nr:deoxynucleoside kinase [Alloprevotella sp.]
MYIAVSGNMGSGKTTLTEMLAEYYGWTPRYEVVDTNPYLEDYYGDIRRWSFNLEVFFLKERFRDLLAIADRDDTVIQDRSIFEGVYVFAANNRQMGNLSDRDFECYMELFESMMMVAKYPDLMIYLRASVPHLVENIQKRGRSYEQAIALDYLENLNRLYEEFIFEKYRGRLLVLDADNLDFQHVREDFSRVVSKIDSELFGLFSPREK